MATVFIHGPNFWQFNQCIHTNVHTYDINVTHICVYWITLPSNWFLCTPFDWFVVYNNLICYGCYQLSLEYWEIQSSRYQSHCYQNTQLLIDLINKVQFQVKPCLIHSIVFRTTLNCRFHFFHSGDTISVLYFVLAKTSLCINKFANFIFSSILNREPRENFFLVCKQFSMIIVEQFVDSSYIPNFQFIKSISIFFYQRLKISCQTVKIDTMWEFSQDSVTSQLKVDQALLNITSSLNKNLWLYQLSDECVEVSFRYWFLLFKSNIHSSNSIVFVAVPL